VKYLSVCSGIEAATVAWHPLGWECVGVAEIDPFACSVLKHHYPSVRNYGNLNDYASWDIAPGAVDVLVGGTPCQSFSLAGLRKGLADPRGNLALVYLGLVDRIRPRYLVWENVPGVLSSGGGRDFGAFLGALVELGYGFAYRVLDAQWVRVDSHPRAVPQRRKRVFVVGCAGADWRRAAEILLEPEGVRGDPPTRRKAWEGAASRTGGGAAVGGEQVTNTDVSNPLTTQCGEATEDGTGRGSPLIASAAAGFAFKSSHYTRGKDGAPSDISPPLARETDRGDQDVLVVTQATMGVRRLTPRECERLQGFPDDYTLVLQKGKPAADGNRYKAIGNSMAVPVMRWIGSRISASDGGASR